MASSTDPDRLRVCILAKANPFLWVHHYINAFRRHCHVITAGPSINADDLERMGRSHLAHLVRPNDIDCEIDCMDTLLSRLPENWRPDLVVSIQSGLPTVEQLDWLSCPTAYISVDSWHDFAELIHARPYDFVFAAQREFVAHFRAAGNASAHWLPLACDPNAHRPITADKSFDICFVGSVDRALHVERATRMELLAKNFSVLAAGALDTDSMCTAYCRGKLGFNSSIAQDVNMRVFEIMAMGIPLLTNRNADVNGLLDLFADGEHLVAYTDDTLIELAARYLNDTAARDKIAAGGRAAVLEHHTYDQRVRQMLDIISMRVYWDALGQRPLLRSRGTLLDYLPTVPGRVADFGMNARVSKYALRRAGAESLTGIARGAQASATRLKSYDTIVAPDATVAGNFDTVLVQSANDLLVNEHVLGEIHAMLRPGGTLVAALSIQDTSPMGGDVSPENVWRAVEGRGYAMLRLELVADADRPMETYLTARKRTRSLKDIAREIYARNPVPGMCLEDVLSQLT